MQVRDAIGPRTPSTKTTSMHRRGGEGSGTPARSACRRGPASSLKLAPCRPRRSRARRHPRSPVRLPLADRMSPGAGH
jgi:hypothetical protein